METLTMANLAHAIESLHTQRGDATIEVERLIRDDPWCIPAHSLRAALIVRADERLARPSLAVSIAVIDAMASPSHPARRHAAAARAWLEGNPRRALEHYDSILNDDPLDIVALVVAHALDFRLGARDMLRDRVARVLPAWKAGLPGYPSVLAMHAFGLEENGDYRRAELVARGALALDPGHPGAIHVLVHVMEMQGRAREGLAFLAETEPAWIDGTGLSVHLAWHRALFHLEGNDSASALSTYDALIATAPAQSMNALTDASALLWRLQLAKVDVQRRWRILADRWNTHHLEAMRSFHAVHAMMAFASSRSRGPAKRLLEALRRARSEETSLLPEEALAEPLCAALLAFVRRDYTGCIRLLSRVRAFQHQCGGSLAQCDLIHLTFTEAALRASSIRLAGALVAERAARKAKSLLNRLLQERLTRLRDGAMLPAVSPRAA